MPAVKANVKLCQGYANCVAKAPEIFDLDEAGIVVLLRDEIDDSEVDSAQEAVAVCPVSAISIEQPQ